MNGRIVGTTVVASVLALLALSGPSAGAAGTPAAEDGTGKEWRQVYETTGLSWNQVAAVCPQDGVTPCSGSAGGRDLTGWVWGTQKQVLTFLAEYAPDLLVVDPPVVSGPAYFFPAISFLGVMRWTFYAATEFSYVESTNGWTSSLDGTGAPVGAGAGYGYPPPSGSLGFGAVSSADTVSPYRGVWLWRPAGLDYTPPVVTPSVSGTLGDNGWYRSDIAVSWTVTDAESPIDTVTGCDPSAVVADTAGATYVCEATSAGGTGTSSVTIKRDVTAPSVACAGPAPVFELGQVGASVAGTVTDATSGPRVASVSGPASTSTAGSFSTAVTGNDMAGNVGGTTCPYRVVVPRCQGLVPTIIGTAMSETINGTPGRDVILALGGNDTVDAGGGNDVVCGDDGNDDLHGGTGRDLLDGGAGSDSIRADAGRDTCTSGEIRMSSCEIIV